MVDERHCTKRHGGIDEDRDADPDPDNAARIVVYNARHAIARDEEMESVSPTVRTESMSREMRQSFQVRDIINITCVRWTVRVARTGPGAHLLACRAFFARQRGSACLSGSSRTPAS